MPDPLFYCVDMLVIYKENNYGLCAHIFVFVKFIFNMW